jgi:hypothetical protein
MSPVDHQRAHEWVRATYLAWWCWADFCTARTREASQLAGAGKAEPPKPGPAAPRTEE